MNKKSPDQPAKKNNLIKKTTCLMHPKSRKVNFAYLGLSITLIATIAFGANILGRSFTSDDVAQQTLTHNFFQTGSHNLLTENDTYVFKMAVYSLFNALMRPSREQVILESLLFNAIMVALLTWWWRKSVSQKGRISWLPFLWLIGSGVFWMSQTVNTNTRNAELAMFVLFAIIAIRKIETPPSRKLLAPYIACFGIVSGLLTYDDPYFLFFVLLPLFIATLINCLRNKKYNPLWATCIVLFVSQLVYKLLGSLFAHYGLIVGKINEINTVSSSIISPSYLPTKALQVTKAYLSLFGASQSPTQYHIVSILCILFNSCVIALAVTGLYLILRGRKFTFLNLWLLLTLIFTLSYVTVTGLAIAFTFRYLLILVPITGYLIAVAVQELATTKHRRYYKLAIGILVVSLALNLVQGIAYGRQKPIASTNLLEYRIILALQENDIAKAYANYWMANVMYYFSDYKSNVLPTLCSAGITYQQPTLVDARRFSTKAPKIGIIVDTSLIVPTRSPDLIAPSCNVAATIKQFGTPSKIVVVNPSVSIVIYPKNPWRSLGVRPDLMTAQ